jgi:hypothetical protein
MRDECTSVCSHCEEAWRAWRELIVTTPGLNESISGVILFDESIRQQKKNNTLFVKFHTDAGKYSPPVTDKEEDETVVSLANRGLPLINLMTAAAKADSNVMWK